MCTEKTSCCTASILRRWRSAYLSSSNAYRASGAAKWEHAACSSISLEADARAEQEPITANGHCGGFSPEAAPEAGRGRGRGRERRGKVLESFMFRLKSSGGGGGAAVGGRLSVLYYRDQQKGVAVCLATARQSQEENFRDLGSTF